MVYDAVKASATRHRVAFFYRPCQTALLRELIMTIHIRRPHSKPHDEARELAEHVARQMQSEFGMDWQWQGDVLSFQRSGVTGSLTVTPDEVVVEAKLGFLLSAIQPRVESEIQRFLDKEFA